MGTDDESGMLWAAMFFIRQARDRDLTKATRVLRHLSRSSDTKIAAKAAQALQQYESKQARQAGVTT